MPAKNTPAIDTTALAAALEALGVVIPAQEVGVGVEVEAPAKPKRTTVSRTKNTRAKSAPKPKSAAKRKTASAGYVLTCGDAWLALGADEDYHPRDETRPATAAQLWRLNSEGMLPALLAQ